MHVCLQHLACPLAAEEKINTALFFFFFFSHLQRGWLSPCISPAIWKFSAAGHALLVTLYIPTYS